MTETITTILCIGLLSIYALLRSDLPIHSIADIFDNRRRAKREEEREKARPRIPRDAHEGI